MQSAASGAALLQLATNAINKAILEALQPPCLGVDEPKACET
jgi:hypothetical protein